MKIVNIIIGKNKAKLTFYSMRTRFLLLNKKWIYYKILKLEIFLLIIQIIEK